MIRPLAYTAALALTLITLLVTTRVVGGTIRPPAIAMFQAQQCGPEPCWHGIQPGVTTIEQAKAILSADRALVADLGFYFDNCWYFVPFPSWKICLGPLHGFSSDVITYVYVRFESAPEAPRLGDMLPLFGEPVASKLCWYRFGVGVNNSRSFVGADVYFENGVYTGAYDPQQPNSTRPDPNMALFLVTYAHRDRRPDLPFWRGFIQESDEQGC